MRIVYVPVTAEERLPKLIAGAIDLECGSTTANAERAKSVAFSPVFFLAGTKLLVPLANGRPAVSVLSRPGRTHGRRRQRHDQRGRDAPAGNDRIAADNSGRRCRGWMMRMTCWLPARRMRSPPTTSCCPGSSPRGRTESASAITGDYLSYEPYAIGLRRDDPAFAALVHDSFARMAGDGSLSRLYVKWLVDRLPNGETLNVPMSSALAEMYRALGQPD